MRSKFLFTLPVAFALASLAIGQTQKADDRPLPRQLSENEVQTITKEANPKSHVEAALKISDARLANALKSALASHYKAAVEDVDVYASLIIYADGYARRLPDARIKDRNNCLKKIEQGIFKQTRNLDAVTREIPFDYREAVMEKIGEVKKIRLRAVDDLLGGGKIINSSNEN